MGSDAASVAAPKGNAVAGAVAKIPVYVHVLRAGLSYEEGNIREATVKRQIDVLNRAFAGGYGGADTSFQFELVSVDYTTNAEWFTMSYNSPAEREAKDALHQGGANALNIYTGTAGANLGWATWPWMQKEHPAGTASSSTSTRCPAATSRASTSATPRRTRRATGSASTTRSRVAARRAATASQDTPPEKVPTSGCPTDKDTCTKDPGLDPVHNYMDYSTDPCYSEFTQGQADRMAGFFVEFRQ